MEAEKSSDLENAWDEEIRERIRKYNAGLTKGIPGPEVFEELDELLRRNTK